MSINQFSSSEIIPGGQCVNCGHETPDPSAKYCGRSTCDTDAALPRRTMPSGIDSSDAAFEVHDGMYSPAVIAAHCQQRRAEIAMQELIIYDLPV